MRIRRACQLGLIRPIVDHNFIRRHGGSYRTDGYEHRAVIAAKLPCNVGDALIVVNVMTAATNGGYGAHPMMLTSRHSQPLSNAS